MFRQRVPDPRGVPGAGLPRRGALAVLLLVLVDDEILAEDGQVENRVLSVPAGLPTSSLTEAGNFLNARISGKTLAELVEGSGLVKPTCRRILLALMEAGFVDLARFGLARNLKPVEKVFQPDALPEVYIKGAATEDERYYVPFTETVSSRPLWISPSCTMRAASAMDVPAWKRGPMSSRTRSTSRSRVSTSATSRILLL